MAIDPRLIALTQLRAQQQQGGRGVQVGAVSPLRVARLQQQDAARQQVAQQAAQSGKNRFQVALEMERGQAGGGDDGGGRGVWGAIFNNPVTKTVLAPLRVMDIPRRIAISGIQEGIDALNGGDASWSDFTEQVGNEQFGFGDVVGDTGNIWLDRIIGFAGDVALDPLTYATLGAAKIPGATGRLAMAGKAAEQQLGREVVEAAGRGGGRAVRKLGDEAAIKALGIEKPGIRFGVGARNVRLPGTGLLDEALSRVAATAREPLIDSRLAQGVRKWGASRDPELRAMVENVVTGGKANDLDLLASARHVTAENARRARSRYTVGRYERAATKFGNQFRDDPTIIHAIESGADTPQTRRWNELTAKVRQHQLDEGASVGELADGKPYVPRVLTDQGRVAFDKPTSAVPGRTAASAVGPEAQQFERTLKPRIDAETGQPFTYTIDGQQFTPTTGTIQEANDWSQAALGYKLYEDSPAKLAASLVENASRAVGDAAYLKSLMKGGRGAQAFRVDSALATRPTQQIADVDTARTFLDDLQRVLGEQVPAAREAHAAAGRGLAGAAGGVAQAERAVQGLDQLVPNADRRAAEAAQRLSGAETALSDIPDVAGELAAVNRQGTDVARQLRDLQGLATEGVQGPRTVPDNVRAMIAEQETIYGALEGRYEQAQQRVAALAPDTPKATRTLAERQANDLLEQMVARRRAMANLWDEYAEPVVGAPLPSASSLQAQLSELGARHGELAPQVAEREALEQQRLAARADQLETAQQAREAGPVAFEPEMALAEARGTRDTALLGAMDAAERVRQTAKKVARSKSGLTGGASYEQLHKDLQFVAENPELFDEATTSMLSKYGTDVAELGDVDADGARMGQFLSAVRKGDLDQVMERELNDGLTRLATDPLIGSDVAMRDEMVKVMRHYKAEVAKEPGGLGRLVDGYTKFFKTYATATPGFHVRNAMSAVFMNLTEGVSFKEMRDGQTIWRAFRKNPDGDWAAKLPDRLRQQAEGVVDAVYASGAGGRYSAAELGARAYGRGGGRRGRGKVTDNFATNFSRNIGEKVEGSVRAGLALKALNDGGSPMDAIMRIKRIHFDYSDVNETDQALRRYIPFWTFMSRNLPLQVQQQWLKPRSYQHYGSLVRNFNTDPEGSKFMPDWMKQEGAFRVGENIALAPDIGATQMAEQVAMLENPSRFLSALNPGAKVPLELATNRDFFYGSNYKANDFQKMGWETAWMGPALEAMGLAESTPEGYFIEKKFANGIYDLIPFLAQTNRLGATTANREGKETQTRLNYWGVPVRMINPEDERKEILYQRSRSRSASPEDARRAALLRALAEAS